MKHLLIIMLFCVQSKATIFSLAQFGDLHIALAGVGTEYSGLTNAEAYIYAHTNDGAVNFAGFISPGDLLEQDTNFYPNGIWNPPSTLPPRLGLAQLTNFFYRLQTNGLFVYICPGNHDQDNLGNLFNGGISGGWTCNSSNLLWNSIFPLSFFSNNPSGVFGVESAGDSRGVEMAYTNGGCKFLFLSYYFAQTNSQDLRVCFSNQTAFITNQILTHPNYYCIVLAHYIVSGRGLVETNAFSNFYINIGPGPESFWDGFSNCPNLFLYIGGHTQTMTSGHQIIYASDGHPIDCSCWNIQSAQWWPAANFENSNFAAMYGVTSDQLFHSAPSLVTPPTWFFRVWTFDTVRKTVTANTVSLPENGIFLSNANTNLSNLLNRGTGVQYVFEHNWTVPFPGTYSFFNLK